MHDVMGVSLRGKGVLALVGVMLYTALVVGVITYQRNKMLNTVIEQQQLYKVEEALAGANTALAYTHLHVDETDAAGNARVNSGHLMRDIATIKMQLRGLKEIYPQFGVQLAQMDEQVAALHSKGDAEVLPKLRAAIGGLVSELDGLAHAVNRRSFTLSRIFSAEYDSIAFIPLVMGLVGGTIFAAIVLVFFSHLVRDIRGVQERAMLVAGGYRGEPLEVTRRDELGALIEGINRVQAELREREQRLELAQERRFHHEKMAAMGSLAAAIAHEINNPIAAIAGIAQGMLESKESAPVPCRGGHVCKPELILEHTKRIAGISRQLAEHTAPHPLQPDLIDLNGLVRNTCSFISYDPRFRGIDMKLELDQELPAVEGVADHLTQVLMNLLINSADALGGVEGRKPSIRVSTRARADEVVLEVQDNGQGMEPAVQSQIFKESFTTKPPDIGRGLGLFLCKALMEENNGHIELASTPGVGTKAQVRLPLQHGAES